MKSTSNRFFTFIKKPWFYIPVILILMGGGAYAYTSNTANSGEEIFTVNPGEFVQSVQVTGKVVPAEDVDLGFEQAGRVASVKVQVGDTVHAGEVVASLSNADLSATVDQREADLEAQQAKLASLQQGTPPADLQLAQNNVEQAKLSLIDELRDAYTKSDDALRKDVDQLYTDPRSINPTITPSDNYELNQSLNDQRLRVGEMLDTWSTEVANLTEANYSDADLSTARMNISVMQKFFDDLSVAVSTYQAGSLEQATIDKYRSDISSGRAEISGVVTSLNSVVSALKQAQDQLVIEQAGTTQDDINAQVAQVKSAEAQLESAQALVGKSIITAPFDGVITKADIKEGEIASPNTPVISISSAAQYQIESYISETDVAKVLVGQDAQVTLDAYGKDVIFNAKVTEVDPAETVVGGISTYKTKLQFNQADARIKSGMTANISIETADKQGSFVIPQEALFLYNGDKVVTVVDSDNSRRNVKVVTGSIGNDGNIEVVSGLSAGDKIVIKKN